MFCNDCCVMLKFCMQLDAARIVAESSGEKLELVAPKRWDGQITRVTTNHSERIDEPTEEPISVSNGNPIFENPGGFQFPQSVSCIGGDEFGIVMSKSDLQRLHKVLTINKCSGTQFGVELAATDEFIELSLTEGSHRHQVERLPGEDALVPQFQDLFSQINVSSDRAQFDQRLSFIGPC